MPKKLLNYHIDLDGYTVDLGGNAGLAGTSCLYYSVFINECNC